MEIGWDRKELIALGYIPAEGSPVDLDYLSTFLPTQDKERTCKFLSISTTVEKVKKIIPDALDSVQLYKNDLMNHVSDILKCHGYVEEANNYAMVITQELYESEIDIDDDEILEANVLYYM